MGSGAAARSVSRAPRPRASGGTVTTAANLVFQGNRNDSSFKAFAAENGELLWSYDVQTGALAGPVTFRVDGEQYVAVVGGYRNTRSYYEPNGSRLFVFKLGGTARLPQPVEFPEPVLAPPENFGTAAELAAGETEYDTYCVACHGVDGQARVFFPDLRYSPALATQELFDAIVLEGVRSDKGMVSFARALTPEDTVALRAYLTAQANEFKAARAN